MPPKSSNPILAHLLHGRNIARWLGLAIVLASLFMIYHGIHDITDALDNSRIPKTTTEFAFGWVGILIGAAVLKFSFSGRKAAAPVLECSECGASNQVHAVYCDQCGAALRDLERCDHCQRAVPRASKFCPDCGQAI